MNTPFRIVWDFALFLAILTLPARAELLISGNVELFTGNSSDNWSFSPGAVGLLGLVALLARRQSKRPGH